MVPETQGEVPALHPVKPLVRGERDRQGKNELQGGYENDNYNKGFLVHELDFSVSDGQVKEKLSVRPGTIWCLVDSVL